MVIWSIKGKLGTVRQVSIFKTLDFQNTLNTEVYAIQNSSPQFLPRNMFLH